MVVVVVQGAGNVGSLPPSDRTTGDSQPPGPPGG
jgi:hypothetical protein